MPKIVTDKVTDDTLAGLRVLNLLHLLPRATGKNGKPATKAEEVTSLYLSSSKVTDAGLKDLVPLKNLATLSLGQTAVTDKAVNDLATLKSLQTLYLTQTKVTGDGVSRLQKALPKCEIIK